MKIKKMIYFVIFVIFFNSLIYAENVKISGNAALVKNALSYMSKGNYVEAIDLLNKAAEEEEDNVKYEKILYYLGDCYYYLGLYDKALFYYENVYKRTKKEEVLLKIIDISYALGDYDKCLKLLKYVSESVYKYELASKIYEKTGDKENLIRTYKKLYRLNGNLDIFVFLYKNNAINVKKDAERQIVNYIKNGNLDFNAIKNYSISEISRLLGYFQQKNSKIYVKLCEIAFYKDKSFYYFNKLVKAYYDANLIRKMKKLIRNEEKKYDTYKFLQSVYMNFLNLGLYDEIERIIKSDKEYYKKASLYSKLLDTYRNSMAYEKYFNELMFLKEKKVFSTGIVNFYVKNVLKDKRWSDALLKNEKIFNVLNDYLKCLAYYKSEKYKKAYSVFLKLREADKIAFLEKNRAYSVFAEFADENELDIKVFRLFLPYFNEKKLKNLAFNLKNELLSLLAFETLVKKYPENLEYSDKVLNKNRLSSYLKEIKNSVLKYAAILKDKKNIRLFHRKKLKEASVFFESKELKISFIKNFINMRVLYDLCEKYGFFTHKDDEKIFKFDIVADILNLYFFKNSKYSIIKEYYDETEIKKDFLYVCTLALLNENIKNYVLSEKNYKYLKLYEIIKNDKNVKKIKNLYFKGL